MSSFSHQPVLQSEVYSILQPMPGDVVCDATLGLGGHAEGFLERIGSHGKLFGLDADADNLSLARKRLEPWSAQVSTRHTNFRHIAEEPMPPLSILFADLGLSSVHLDDASRGFSFRFDAPLDLRFDRTSGKTAAEWIEVATVQEVTDALRNFGEFTGAFRFAGVLKKELPQTTFALKSLVEVQYLWRAPSVLPQVFQALRIAVNDELGALKTLLMEGPKLLAPGGRFGVISFHSLEDRMVKQAFRDLSTAPKNPDTGADVHPAVAELLTKKPVVASEQEVTANPRSRSAKFRAIRIRPFRQS